MKVGGLQCVMGVSIVRKKCYISIGHEHSWSEKCSLDGAADVNVVGVA